MKKIRIMLHSTRTQGIPDGTRHLLPLRNTNFSIIYRWIRGRDNEAA